MLDREGLKNLEDIKEAANSVWGDQCQFGEIQIQDAPFCMFDLPMRLYGRFDILLVYDRSIMDISIKTEGKFIWMTDFTDLEVVEGFDSCKPENLRHNFEVLDEVVRTMK